MFFGNMFLRWYAGRCSARSVRRADRTMPRDEAGSTPYACILLQLVG